MTDTTLSALGFVLAWVSFVANGATGLWCSVEGLRAHARANTAFAALQFCILIWRTVTI